ncbi:MAG TPA: ethylbenzene dehydrogenase-related protein [Symbiobacteriaceae bacterium]|nr:ethylbenzene dehydrogenase-related protein [Symbiobacteriaceae bacterium]
MQILRRFSRRQIIIGATAAGLLLLAAGLSVYQIGFRKPVGTPTLVVRPAKTAIALDPWDATWKKVSAVTMPLTITSTPGAKARDVSVKAVTDGTNLAVRMEWADGAKDVTTLRPQDFGDQAAIQLSDQVSNACMGQVGMNPVHIWQWKADWQFGSRDMKTQFPNIINDGFHDDTGKALLTEDLYARPAFVAGNARAAEAKDKPVESLIAEGFGTLTSAGAHPMQSKGDYQNGRWAVVFMRPLQGETGDVSLTAGAPLQAAFAVWDGQFMQRDGMKYTTSWVVLQLEGK